MTTLYHDTGYSLNHLVEDIKHGNLALPDIQRPFVWSSTKVRDLFDSMYRDGTDSVEQATGAQHGQPASFGGDGTCLGCHGDMVCVRHRPSVSFPRLSGHLV